MKTSRVQFVRGKGPNRGSWRVVVDNAIHVGTLYTVSDWLATSEAMGRKGVEREQGKKHIAYQFVRKVGGNIVHAEEHLVLWRAKASIRQKALEWAEENRATKKEKS